MQQNEQNTCMKMRLCMLTHQFLKKLVCILLCVSENVPWPQQLLLSRQDLDLEAASLDL